MGTDALPPTEAIITVDRGSPEGDYTGISVRCICGLLYTMTHPANLSVQVTGFACKCGYQCSQAADRVRVPTGEDEAALMVLLGTQWLESNTPHRLRSSGGAGTNHQDPGTPGDERRLAVGAARVEGVGATASLPEPSGGESSYRRMFEAACSSLGEIAREAGVPEEHADDGPEAILDAIRALKQRTSPEPCGDCKDCDTLITERDNAEEQADKLAECIADLLGIDIGEHSSGNAPWQNAIDAAEYELDKRKRSAPEPRDEPLPPCSTCGGETVPFCTSCGYTTTKPAEYPAYTECQHDHMKPNPTLRATYPKHGSQSGWVQEYRCNVCQCSFERPIATAGLRANGETP